jgi:hypothetical protein
MSHEKALSGGRSRLIEQLKIVLQKARQEVSFYEMEKRAFEVKSARVLPQSRPSIPLVLTQMQATELPEIKEKLAFQDQETGLCLVSDTHLLYPEQLDVFSEVWPNPFILIQSPLIDEYQILQALVAGARALTLSPHLLGRRRAQLYFEKIQLWGILPIIEITTLQDLSEALVLSPEILLINTSLSGAEEIDLVMQIRSQIKRTTHLIYQGQINSVERWMRLQSAGVDCFCLNSQDLKLLAEKDIYMQMSRPHQN